MKIYILGCVCVAMRECVYACASVWAMCKVMCAWVWVYVQIWMVCARVCVWVLTLAGVSVSERGGEGVGEGWG